MELKFAHLVHRFSTVRNVFYVVQLMITSIWIRENAKTAQLGTG